MPEELWTEVHDIVQEAVIKTIPKKNKCKKAKWLSEEANCQHPLDHQNKKQNKTKQKPRVPEKLLLLLYFATKPFECVDHNKLWKILKEMGIPGHLTCLLRNLCPGQEATVRTGYQITDWFQIWKGV